MKPSEAQLCADFIEWIKGFGWVCYAEVSGWDILLANPDTEEQIGIQAKLRLNWEVLRQCLDPAEQTGPDYRAVLVPKQDFNFHIVCFRLGLVVFSPIEEGGKEFLASCGSLMNPLGETRPFNSAVWWAPKKREALPMVVPDEKNAGTSAPVRMTEWKQQALKLCAVLEVRGYLTREDFKKFGVSFARWVPSRWLELDDAGLYVRGPNLHFPEQMPSAYQQIKAKLDPRDFAEPESAAFRRRT